MQLNRTPLYLQIVGLLHSELAEGRPAVGERFPSERELAERFDVSRATANKILSVLVSEGALQHRKGVGAFVAQPALEHDLSALLSFTEKARRAGHQPETLVTVYKTEPHPDFGTALHLVRHRLVDGMPAILECRWLDAARCGNLTPELAAGSLYDALSGPLGLSLGHADQRVRAVVPTAEERAVLKTRQGTACLRVTGNGYLADGSLLWVEDTLFRGDLFEFHATLGSPPNAADRPQGLVFEQR